MKLLFLRTFLALSMIIAPSLVLSNHIANDALQEPKLKPASENLYESNALSTSTSEGSNPHPESASEGTATANLDAQNQDTFVAPCLYGDPSVNCSTIEGAGQLRSFMFGHRIESANHLLTDIDGLMLKYGLGDVAISGIAGFPTYSGAKKISTNKQLYGVSVNLLSLPKGWDLGSYLVEYKNSKQNDGTSMGTVLRYSEAHRSLLISADYDLQYRSLGRFVLSSAWKILPSSTLSTTLNYFKRNILSPKMPYLNNSLSLVDGWRLGLPTDRIITLSANGTKDIAALGLSLSHLLLHNIRMNSDVAVLNVSDETLSNSQSLVPDSYNEYYFKLTLSGKGLLLPGESSSLSFHSRVSNLTRHSSSSLNTSYAFTRQWRLVPKLQIDYTDNHLESTSYWKALPTLKLEYHWQNQSKLQFTTAGEWRKTDHASEENYDSSYVLSLGYQTKF
ncbi:MAG: hypothetical protein P8163_07920 [Candidatus Thiodiazotropha sp.]